MAMARAVLVAALVLCAAAALAHAGRFVEEAGRGSGLEASSSWLQAPAEAPSAYAGGVKLGGLGSAGGFGDGFVDLLWYVFKWAKDAFAAAVGWKGQ